MISMSARHSWARILAIQRASSSNSLKVGMTVDIFTGWYPLAEFNHTPGQVSGRIYQRSRFCSRNRTLEFVGQSIMEAISKGAKVFIAGHRGLVGSALHRRF